MNYYEILGVSSSSTESEIRNAYKKLALKYHPDKNHDPEAVNMFHEISNAYQTLSDTKKRNDYDSYGKIPDMFKSPEEIFEHMFKDMNPMLGKLLSSTFTNFTNVLLDDNKTIFDAINEFKTDEVIEKSSDLLKSYLNKKTKPYNSKYVYNLNIDITDNFLDKLNEIEVNIEFLRRYTHISINFIENNSKFESIFSLINDTFDINYRNKEYHFVLKYKFPPNIVRKKNSSNLYLNYEIDIHSYTNGFYFDYPLSSSKSINKNILINNSNIVKINEAGILKDHNKFGHLFITFKPALEKLRESCMKDNIETIFSLETSSFF